MHGVTNGYKAMPLKSDSTSPALYAGAAVLVAFPNDRLHDDVIAIQGGLHRTHQFGNFQAYYGINGSLGNYRVSAGYDNPDGGYFFSSNSNLNDSLLNALSGNYRFGSWGLTGGLNMVTQFPGGGEWRFLGVELDWQQEWGDYYRFRKNLPKSAANVIDDRRHYATISLSSDIVIKVDEIRFGYKAAMSFSTRKLNYYSNGGTVYSKVWPFTFSQTLHVGGKRSTWFGQLNIGYQVVGAQAGLCYRLN
jgi:hypothetical protein